MFEKPDSGAENDSEKISRREFLKRASAVAVVNLSGCAVMSDQEAEPQIDDPETSESYEDQLEQLSAFREIISNPRLKETATFLNNTYKGADSEISFKLFWDLQTHETLEMVEEEMESQGKTVLDSQLGRYLLKEISKTYTDFWSHEALVERIEKDEAERGLTATFSGFESMQFADGDTLSDNEIKTLIETRFPNKRWLYENIGAYRYSGETRNANTFRIAGTAEQRSIMNTLSPGKEQEVLIHETSRSYDKHEFLSTIAHEVAHHHDWVGTLRLPLHERLEFLRDVTEHFHNPNRYQHNYVDRDVPEDMSHEANFSEESLLYRQVVEYWAMINEKFETISNFEEIFPDEANLVKKWREVLIVE